jgi:hypothetical protein
MTGISVRANAKGNGTIHAAPAASFRIEQPLVVIVNELTTLTRHK